MSNFIKTTLGLLLAGASTLLMPSLVLAADSADVFTGFDVEEGSKYFYVGGVYALNGDVAKEGFILRGQIAGGKYEYDTSGVVGGEVDAKQQRYHAGLGYQWANSNVRTSVYAGADRQNHNLSPNDRRNSVRGLKDGLITQVEIESLATPIYFAGIGSYSTVFDTYWARVRGGMPLADYKVGMELTGSGNESHDSVKLGVFTMVPISKKMSVDVSVGHFDTDGDGNRGGNKGTYFAANLNLQF